MEITLFYYNFPLILSSISESEEPDYDHQPVGRAVLERLQAQVGPRRVWGSQTVARSQWPHLATRHCALQQVGGHFEKNKWHFRSEIRLRKKPCYCCRKVSNFGHSTRTFNMFKTMFRTIFQIGFCFWVLEKCEIVNVFLLMKSLFA